MLSGCSKPTAQDCQSSYKGNFKRTLLTKDPAKFRSERRIIRSGKYLRGGKYGKIEVVCTKEELQMRRHDKAITTKKMAGGTHPLFLLTYNGHTMKIMNSRSGIV